MKDQTSSSFGKKILNRVFVIDRLIKNSTNLAK